MRYQTWGLGALLLVGLAGCETFVVRTYPLGPKPQAAMEVIDRVTAEQVREHGDEVMEDLATGETWTPVKRIDEEGVVVVTTTREGHRQIESALEDLRRRTGDEQ